VITTPVPDLPDIVAIFADRGHACAMSFDLELYCWGDNRYGQIGNGTFDDQPSPQFIFS
jgi:alpha-tubulin suppressor-like RCC1 family protein